MKVNFQNQIYMNFANGQQKNNLSKEKEAEFKSYGYGLSGKALQKALVCGAASIPPVALFVSKALKKPVKSSIGYAIGAGAALSSILYPLFDITNFKKRKAKLEELKNNDV